MITFVFSRKQPGLTVGAPNGRPYASCTGSLWKLHTPDGAVRALGGIEDAVNALRNIKTAPLAGELKTRRDVAWLLLDGTITEQRPELFILKITENKRGFTLQTPRGTIAPRGFSGPRPQRFSTMNEAKAVIHEYARDYLEYCRAHAPIYAERKWVDSLPQGILS